MLHLKSTIMKEMLENLKTSLFGAVAGLPMIYEGAMANDWKMVLAGLGMLLVGIFASDAKK
jgi:hypothetical protein